MKTFLVLLTCVLIPEVLLLDLKTPDEQFEALHDVLEQTIQSQLLIAINYLEPKYQGVVLEARNGLANTLDQLNETEIASLCAVDEIVHGKEEECSNFEQESLNDDFGSKEECLESLENCYVQNRQEIVTTSEAAQQNTTKCFQNFVKEIDGVYGKGLNAIKSLRVVAYLYDAMYSSCAEEDVQCKTTVIEKFSKKINGLPTTCEKITQQTVLDMQQTSTILQPTCYDDPPNILPVILKNLVDKIEMCIADM